MRKILIACDSFKESLSAFEVNAAIEDGFRHVFPDARYVLLPMADGGEGTAAILSRTTGGMLHTRSVRGPLGAPVAAHFGVLGDGRTAVVELAEAAGLALIPEVARDPLLASTYGVGELISAALDLGCNRIILALGGSATNDGGAGMAQALGIRFHDADVVDLAPGGVHLATLAAVDLETRDRRLDDAVIEIACDVHNPLCGPDGASAIFGPQKGATPAMVRMLDDALMRFSTCLETATGVNVRDMPGGGAAGGAGAGGVALLGGRLRAGVDIVADTLGLDALLDGVDLVITGEGRLDHQTIRGKVPVGVARRAKSRGIPVIAIAGSLGTGCDEVHAHGIDAVFDVVPRPGTLADALRDARDNLTRTARNVAATLAIGGR
ncbi:glycerate kinase [Tanticharoenia sakaeratensis]|uniref:Glycerate kinase n=1 Tax=Tanticharoenia sakaeratensis NBRC 103193 TaxID=1231623 RepID=A0A0D6MGW1_9PROT|nr:glycerate kinase [Tanticharoenia sakaeratensis]GAN52852.1 glycerate kinase [Tanticharoenia sakaeratensis NBRC 103193]GBQ18381.1 glycerate kinase [Tanticharoenia sakaeratensis NBRC 103193]